MKHVTFASTKNNNESVMEWLFTLNTTPSICSSIHNITNTIFCSSLRGYSRLLEKILLINYDITMFCIHNAFNLACTDNIYSNLDTLKALLKYNPIIRTSHFVYLCANGHFECAKLLYSVTNIITDTAFKYACMHGGYKINPDCTYLIKPETINVIKWFISIKPFKYSIKILKNKPEIVVSYKINSDKDEKMLFIIYVLIVKGYTNQLTYNILSCIKNL